MKVRLFVLSVFFLLIYSCKSLRGTNDGNMIYSAEISREISFFSEDSLHFKVKLTKAASDSFYISEYDVWSLAQVKLHDKYRNSTYIPFELTFYEKENKEKEILCANECEYDVDLRALYFQPVFVIRPRKKGDYKLEIGNEKNQKEYTIYWKE